MAYAYFGRPTLHARARRRRRIVIALSLLIAAALGTVVVVRHARGGPPAYASTSGWPATGQGAYQVGSERPAATAGQRPVPIASLAKVMTAVVVLAEHPLRAGAAGPTLRVTPADVADTLARRLRDESLVDVESGERLSERDALMALLLPSANNVAAMLARWVSGSVEAFVAEMNRTARRLGMAHTTYTDPSGFEPTTVSTAADQLALARFVARDATLTALTATRSYRLPVAGVVRNTNRLLGRDGFVGTKTGSDDAAGGCFMFRAHRPEGDVLGVVLGQRGGDLITAGLAAARALVNRVAPER